MTGKIIKGIAGFYYVHIEGMGVYECKAKGIFRNHHIKPLVGDNVCMSVLDEQDKEGSITEILPRKNELLRPAVANIDQALIIFAIVRPDPNYNLLDRFLIRMERQQLPCIICFNKQDIASEEERQTLLHAYEGCGCHVLFASAHKEEGMKELRRLLAGKTTTVAGPSGVGKSTIINCLQPEANMATGAISAKIERGRHTTRHSEIIALGEDTYIMDTPGFTSLSISEVLKEELGGYYPEFRQYESFCRFRGCAHISEPDCGVKKAVEEGKISRVRYDNYRMLYQELKDVRRY
ncbi:MAG: ribosome small subunit-dependent GTPase A [Blautia sp.]|nr:ribosome small subunit-dependent GTPase A [Lachnoclostridium sp.]MCM1210474.1 ribosome small subunit-dependent GTPase A [Blautia sp.]